MKPNEQIKHNGIVTQILGNNVQVQIVTQSACASCHVKGSCTVSEVEEKIIDTYVENPESYKNGDRVEVAFAQSLGIRALMLGYLLPFLLMFAVLIVSLNFTSNELFGGLVSIASLVPYYLILYLLRHKHKQQFVFLVEKISQ